MNQSFEKQTSQQINQPKKKNVFWFVVGLILLLSFGFLFLTSSYSFITEHTDCGLCQFFVKAKIMIYFVLITTGVILIVKNKNTKEKIIIIAAILLLPIFLFLGFLESWHLNNYIR